jgi:pre-mRNA-splicing helicase BRR2
MDIHIQSFSIPHFPSLMIAMSKPAYLAIAEYSSTKPVIIFVPGRQQCRMTAEDLLIHCGADDDEDLFLNAELADIQPHLDHVSDRGLTETLKHGIGFYHEALSKQDRRIVERLFQSGAIQVLIASKVRSLFLPCMRNTNYTTGYCLESPCCQLSCHHNGRPVIRGQGTPLC